MAEFLVRVKSKVGANVYQDCALTKRGDVIAVREDGWVWSVRELTNPEWRILKIPGFPMDEAEAFLEAERPIDENDKRQTLRRRWFSMNLDDPNLPADLKAFIADDKRAQPFYVVRLNFNRVRALKLTKQRVPDPMFG